MLRNYEAVFIMTPVLSDEQMKETVNKFQKILKDKGAEIIYEDNWGLRKMAYPIQKKSTGFYHYVAFKAEGTLIADLEIAFKRDERIIRFLTLVLDKHALAYSIKRQNLRTAAAQVKAESINN
jgi:small subunit ribosomal protein S6